MKKMFKRFTDWCSRHVDEFLDAIVVIGIFIIIIEILIILWAGMKPLFIPNDTPKPESNYVQIVETTKAEVTEKEPEPEPEEPKVQYYDIPLSKDLQEYIFGLCANYEIEPELIFAIIKKESKFVASSIGDYGNSYGLMQIQPKWHQARMDSLFCPNLLNPYQNVTVGIDYLGELFDTGNSLEWVLMAYNSGPSTAYKNTASGRVSQYAKTVLLYYKNFKVGV